MSRITWQAVTKWIEDSEFYKDEANQCRYCAHSGAYWIYIDAWNETFCGETPIEVWELFRAFVAGYNYAKEKLCGN